MTWKASLPTRIQTASREGSGRAFPQQHPSRSQSGNEGRRSFFGKAKKEEQGSTATEIFRSREAASFPSALTSRELVRDLEEEEEEEEKEEEGEEGQGGGGGGRPNQIGRQTCLLLLLKSKQ